MIGEYERTTAAEQAMRVPRRPCFVLAGLAQTPKLIAISSASDSWIQLGG
jgi:hypothetical protein